MQDGISISIKKSGTEQVSTSLNSIFILYIYMGRNSDAA